jgi:hypothetical protein
VAVWPGGPADQITMFGAHLDGVAAGPGINDNGSGSATLLENALVLAQQNPAMSRPDGHAEVHRHGGRVAADLVRHRRHGPAGRLSTCTRTRRPAPAGLRVLPGDADRRSVAGCRWRASARGGKDRAICSVNVSS